MRALLKRALPLVIAAAVGAAISMFWQHRNRAHSTAGDPVPPFDFALLDTRGNPWQLSRAEARFVVLYVHGIGCPIVRQDLVTLQSLAKDMTPRGVTFALINANSQDSEDELRADAESLGVTLPLLRDDAQLVARTLRIERTGEALVLERSSGEVRWRGPLDDRVGYGTQRPQASVNYLRDALMAILGDERPAAGLTAHGCAITYLAPKAAAPTYARDVAPILQQHCVRCHSEGGPAPWHMTDYDTVRGFAAMTREVLLTRRMPPWNADTPAGRFRDDPTLSEDEIRTLVTWIDNGTPYGDGDDPLDRPAEKRPDFSLGQPDLIVSLPPQDVPATGVLPYRDVTLPLGLTKDVWVRATEIRPGDPTVLHHVHMYLKVPGVPARQTPLNFFARYAPGVSAYVFPDGTGKRIPAGASFTYQLHYTTNGKAAHDATQVAFYFFKEPPPRELWVASAINTRVDIPPGERDHHETARYDFEHAVDVFALSPHLHYRGREMRMSAEYPDGTREELLSVPFYDFNWQIQYDYVTPKHFPAGTTVRCDATFDNSADNPANPDPKQRVSFGPQVQDEMHICYLMVADASTPDAAARP